jgi:hypothetical protein
MRAKPGTQVQGLVLGAKIAGFFVLLANLTACMSLRPPSCPDGQEAAVQELIYFGTTKPGGQVSADDWDHFRNENVTPAFPEGFTFWEASGQWRSAAGEIGREASYVLSIVHPRTAATEVSVQQLMSAYKASFQQEAVLRVTSNVCRSL